MMKFQKDIKFTNFSLADELFRSCEEANRDLIDDKFDLSGGALNNGANESSKKQKKREKKADLSPWFNCDYKTYKTRADYIARLYNNPIISPLIYQHFDELSSVDLCTLAGDLDFLVDDAIEISNIWKGNTSLAIIENLMHGFIYFEHSSYLACEEATRLTVQRLQQAVGLF